MPARSHQIPGGARVLIFECDRCRESAPFGEGVNLREALRTGDVTKAGRWACGRRPDGRLYCKRKDGA